ncbi:Ubiquitin conjugating enzyme E2 [Spironucleus salmonicida]|uniref:Ubiquitin conjugating enzyme E2 n=1 Tax=Spironucleus salmonicida TaxID=348837 RepID=V6LPZ3_9EUKA|nr:Ubiquitin conjugating enzyme E2 [Spironucleus salmonicida]|eukprot:EST46313.1 Ubiquitin conjugating enzyme E2 [Spironucleus salmonicida]
MDQIRKRRLLNDLKDIKKNYSQYTIISSDLSQWVVSFIFNNKKLTLQLKFPDTFPSVAPQAKFLCKLFHPNIWSDGRICLDTLNSRWVPAMSVASIITTILSLLEDANPDSPANTDAAEIFKRNREQYQELFEKAIQEIE